jgi:hypothetical protein
MKRSNQFVHFYTMHHFHYTYVPAGALTLKYFAIHSPRYQYLYVNIPIADTLRITNFWLHKQKHNNGLTEQIIHALGVILKQNYFQYNNQFYKPKKESPWDPPFPALLLKFTYNTWKNLP